MKEKGVTKKNNRLCTKQMKTRCFVAWRGTAKRKEEEKKKRSFFVRTQRNDLETKVYPSW